MNKTDTSITDEATQESEKSSPEISYFSISLGRLFLFSILTFNLYEIYWFAKNWIAIKKATDDKIWPIARAIFAPLFCYGLFSQIFKSASDHGYKKSDVSGWAAAYIVLTVGGNAFARLNAQDFGIGLGTYWLISYVLVVVTPLPLLAVQRAVNFYNAKINANYRPTVAFTGWEIFWTVIGSIVLLLSVLGVLIDVSS
jgi:hypothetical protein